MLMFDSLEINFIYKNSETAIVLKFCLHFAWICRVNVYLQGYNQLYPDQK